MITLYGFGTIFPEGRGARPAWGRTLGVYAERLGVSLEEVR